MYKCKGLNYGHGWSYVHRYHLNIFSPSPLVKLDSLQIPNPITSRTMGTNNNVLHVKEFSYGIIFQENIAHNCDRNAEAAQTEPFRTYLTHF